MFLKEDMLKGYVIRGRKIYEKYIFSESYSGVQLVKAYIVVVILLKNVKLISLANVCTDTVVWCEDYYNRNTLV